MSVDFGIYDLYDAICERSIACASNTLNSRNIIGDSNRKMLVRLIFRQVKISLKQAKRENRKRRRFEKRIERHNKKVTRYCVKAISRIENQGKKERRKRVA